MDMLLKVKDYQATPAERDVKSVLDGILQTDWRQAFIARGFGWHFDIGAFSTPVAGGGATAVIDQDRPSGAISVATGWTLIPLRIAIQAQPNVAQAPADEIEALIAVDRLAAVVGGTWTAETPTNMKTSITSGCPLLCQSICSGACTNPTLGVELARQVKECQEDTAVGNRWDGGLDLLYEPRFPHFIVGPAGLYVYVGGTAAITIFAQLDFLVVPSGLIASLV